MNENKKLPNKQNKEKFSSVKDGRAVDKKDSDSISSKSSVSVDKNNKDGGSANSKKHKKNNFLILTVVILVLISSSLFLYFNSNAVIDRFNIIKDSFFSSKKIQVDSIDVYDNKKEDGNDNISNIENNLTKNKYESEAVIEESISLNDEKNDSSLENKQQESFIDDLRVEESKNFEEDFNNKNSYSYNNQKRPEMNGYEESDSVFHKNENSESDKLSSEQISLIKDLKLLVDEIDNLEFISIPSSKKDISLSLDSDSTIFDRIISQLKGLINVRKINDPKANTRTNDFFVLVKQQMKIYLLTSRILIASDLLINAKSDLNLSLKILDEYFDEHSEINQNYRNKLLFLIKKLEMIYSS